MSRERPKSTERGDAGRQIAKQTVKLSPAPPKIWLWLEMAGAFILQGFQAIEPAVSRLQRLFKYHFRPVSDYLRPLKPGMKQEVF